MRTKSVRLASFVWFTLFLLLSSEDLLPQLKEISREDIYSEGNFYGEAGILYSDAIVVKFKDKVIDLPRGVRYAGKSDIIPGFPGVIGLVNRLEQQRGPVRLVKQIRDAKWGDVIRTNKRTGEIVQIHDLSQLFTIRFSSLVPLESTIQEFLKLPAVEYAHQPVSIVYFDSPNDPKFQDGSQWNLEVVQATNAWDITHGSSTVKIGIVDEGTKQNHEDLQGKIVGGDGVEGEHGTWVAGVAGALTNNLTGVASLGWELRLNTYGNGGVAIGNESFTAENINLAANNSAVINMSWGTFKYATQADIEELMPDCAQPHSWVNALIPTNHPEIKSAVANAIAMGVVCVNSAGNGSKNLNYGPNPDSCDPMKVPFDQYPAQYTDVIAVSGTELVNGVEKFVEGWNEGNFIDVSGPAVNIWTTDIGGGYHNPKGTSFSAPLVSALAGLMVSADNNLDIQGVYDIITQTADKIGQYTYDSNGSNGWNKYMGYGRINAYRALHYVVDPPSAPQDLVISNAFQYGQLVRLSWTNTEPDLMNFNIYRMTQKPASPWTVIGTSTSASYKDREVRISNSGTSILYHYYVTAVDLANNESSQSNSVSTYGEEGVVPKIPIGGPNLPRESNIPADFTLGQNYPNPFNPTAKIQYQLPEPGDVKLVVYDMLGRLIGVLFDQYQSAGYHEVTWDGRNTQGNEVTSGVYFYHLIVTRGTRQLFTDIRKMVLMR